MSKLHNPFFLFAAAFLSILCVLNAVRAQDLDVRIKVGGRLISVQGKKLAPATAEERTIYFSREYAGHEIPPDRISALSLTDASGRPVLYRKMGEGQYFSDGKFNSWSYDLVPGVPKKGAAAAHVSWLADDRGILMLDDILPKFIIREKCLQRSSLSFRPAGRSRGP